MSDIKSTWILTAVGKDRPGIVARVTKILFGLGCNLEDSSMTRLGGEFAIMLVFSSSKPLTERALEQACAPLSSTLKLAVHLKALTTGVRAGKWPDRAYFISVYGADRPGIVYRVSQLLADLRINITDVSTHRTAPDHGARAKPLYLMLLEVELPSKIKASELEPRLQKLGNQLGCEVSLRSSEASIL